MKRIYSIIIVVVILALGYLAMILLLDMGESAPKRPLEPHVKIVETLVVKLDNVPSLILAYGRVVSMQPVDLYSEVSGTIMEGEVPFQPAQTFRRGDMLARIDDRQIRYQINGAKSEFLSTLAKALPEIKSDFPDEYNIWQNYFDNCRFDHNLDTMPEPVNKKTKLILSRFNVYKLYFTIKDMEVKLEKHYFYAPFDGSIVSAKLRVGSTVRNGSLMGEIINLEQLEVEVPVPINDLEWIDYKKPVFFESLELAAKWVGEIKRIGSAIDDRTQTVPVYIAVNQENPSTLINGVFLQAEISGLQIENALVIPRRAIYNERFVYIIENGSLVSREVAIVRREKSTVIINGGLNDGDTLVTDVMQGVAPGMPAQAKKITTEDRSQ